MVRPFCKLGSPEGSSFRLSESDARISCGLPELDMISKMHLSEDSPPMGISVSDKRSRMRMTPIWPRGFWSNHSVTYVLRYCRVTSNLLYISLSSRKPQSIAHRVGRKSLSCIDSDRSSMMNMCRMIDRRKGVSEAAALLDHPSASSSDFQLGDIPFPPPSRQ